jgi:hypothetical protein
MKWRGSYRGGEIELETSTRDELDKQLDDIGSVGAESKESKSATRETAEKPTLSGNLGCNDAIRQALGSTWGRLQPRTMSELQQTFEANALFFGTGTLSGSLTYLTKSGAIRRIDRGGKWAYILVST